MNDHRVTVLLAGALAITGFPGASAQETGGVRIDGSVHNVTTVTRTQNGARGSGARAKMSIGSIHGGAEIDGPLRMDVSADRIDNYAGGAAESAITSIGSLHKGAKASGEIVVHTGDVSNVSDGPGDASCVIIGSKGHIPECDR